MEQAMIVDEAAHSSELPELLFLLGGGFEAVTIAATDHPGILEQAESHRNACEGGLSP